MSYYLSATRCICFYLNIANIHICINYTPLTMKLSPTIMILLSAASAVIASPRMWLWPDESRSALAKRTAIPYIIDSPQPKQDTYLPQRESPVEVVVKRSAFAQPGPVATDSRLAARQFDAGGCPFGTGFSLPGGNPTDPTCGGKSAGDCSVGVSILLFQQSHVMY